MNLYVCVEKVCESERTAEMLLAQWPVRQTDVHVAAQQLPCHLVSSSGWSDAAASKLVTTRLQCTFFGINGSMYFRLWLAALGNVFLPLFWTAQTKLHLSRQWAIEHSVILEDREHSSANLAACYCFSEEVLLAQSKQQQQQHPPRGSKDESPWWHLKWASVA